MTEIKSFVYFVQESGHLKLIKIGFSNCAKSKRIETIRCYCPYEISVLAKIKGSQLHEKWLHEKFKDYHARGEWFYPADDLLSFIESAKHLTSLSEICGLEKVVKNAVLQKAIDLIGGQAKAARLFGISQTSVFYWLNRSKQTPAEYCFAIERATDGQVTRQDLRPDLWPPSPQQNVSGAQ